MTDLAQHDLHRPLITSKLSVVEQNIYMMYIKRKLDNLKIKYMMLHIK